MISPLHIVMLGITAAAAFIDTRSGRIPNWLTLPAIALGPIYGLFVSPSHALASLLAVFVVGLVPYIMYRMHSIGGGDVKLFAALGGLGGVTMGLEAMVYSLFAALFFASILLAWRGQLFLLAGNVFRMLCNPLRPKGQRKPLASSEMHQLRLGLSIFVGTGVALAYQYASV